MHHFQNKIGLYKMSRPEILADSAAVGSIATFLGMSLADWDSIIHIVAGIVAIIAGITAAIFHIKRIRQLGKKG